jgi:hypothetical protein
MSLRTTSFALAAAAGIALGSAAFADQPQQSGQQQQQQQGNRQADAQQQIDQLLAQIAADPKTAADKLFILTAALHNQSEIALAREVLEKSQKTHEQLQQTAQAIGLPLPQELAQAAVQEVHIVAALPADQLDQQYTAHAQADNAQDVSDYQSHATIAQDPQVRRFAKQQAAEAQQRSQSTDQTARGMGMPGGGEAQPAGAAIKGDSGR